MIDPSTVRRMVFFFELTRVDLILESEGLRVYLALFAIQLYCVSSTGLPFPYTSYLYTSAGLCLIPLVIARNHRLPRSGMQDPFPVLPSSSEQLPPVVSSFPSFCSSIHRRQGPHVADATLVLGS